MFSKLKNLLDLKNELKILASNIRTLKSQLRSHPIEERPRQSDTQYSIWRNKRNYRHYLIAYCELRGLLREQIEKPALNNMPDEDEIERIKTNYLPIWNITDIMLPEEKLFRNNNTLKLKEVTNG